MNTERLFRIALLVSIMVHGALILRAPGFLNFPNKNKDKDTEIRYVKPPEESIKKEAPLEKPKAKDPFLKLSSKITIDENIPPPFIEKDSIFDKSKKISSNAIFEKPVFSKPDVIAIKKKITLPPIDLDKINDPSYISYYQIVREKIKRAAYQNYTGSQRGEVSLAFVISRQGVLMDVRLVEEKSSTNNYLRNIAIKSLKDASPFPVFPPELNYSQLSFVISITFEVED